MEAFYAEGGDEVVVGFEGLVGAAAGEGWGGEGGGVGGEEAVEEVDLGDGCRYSCWWRGRVLDEVEWWVVCVCNVT